MRPPKPVIAVLVLGSLLAGGYYIDRQREAERSTLSGTFESRPSALSPRISGRVRRILVQEGERVREGDPLVLLAAPDAAHGTVAALAQAEAAKAREALVRSGARQEEIVRQQSAVDEARAGLQKLRNGSRPEEIRAAASKVRQAEARLRILLSGARPQELNEAKAAERQAFARLQAVERGPTDEERASLQARVRSAEALLEQARRDSERKRQLADAGAIAVAVADVAETQRKTAEGNLQEARETLRRAELGGPPEEVSQARQAYRQAQERLSLVLAGPREEEIAAARAELEVTRENLRLLQRGPRVEEIAAAEARLAGMEAALRLLQNGSRQEDIEQARAATKAAQSQAEANVSLYRETKILAPSDGVVERVLVAVGDLLSPGTPAVRFTDPQDLWLRVYVPESVLAQVATGATAKLSVDGVPNLVEGVVESIGTQGEFTPANLQTPEERGKQVFAVRIRLAKPDPRVKPGMSATVEELGNWR